VFTSTFAKQPEPYTLDKEMRNAIDSIGHTFQVNYGPTPWKNEQYNWYLDQKLEETKQAITPQTSIKEFQHHLNDFFKSMNDLHSCIIFHSTAFASLPFELRTTEGRFFVHRFMDKLADNAFQILTPGDEILSMDGEPIKTVFDRFLAQTSVKNPSPSDIGYALSRFTRRAGATLSPMPENLKKTIFEVRKKGSKTIRKMSYKWKYSHESMPFRKGLHPVLTIKPLESTPFYRALARADINVEIKQDNMLIEQLFERLGTPTGKEVIQAILNKYAHSEDSLENELDEAKIEEIIRFTKQKEGTVLPPLGKILWKSNPQDYFEAFIYELDTKQKVGFIRLQTFMPDNTINIIWKILKQKKLAKEPWDEFADKINYFKDRTDILVIDQTDNHGGADLYTFAIASMLSDTPLATSPDHHTLNSDLISSAVEISQLSEDELMKELEESNSFVNQTILGYPADILHMNRMISYYKYLLSCWKKGEVYTNPVHSHGVDKVIPSKKARYVKPIIVLIDEFAMSCGDVFPAMMQDNNRALLFGHTTAGAGGAVKKTDFPNRLGIDFYAYTDTLLIRSNGMPIENIGVSPDVQYHLTAEDLTNGYPGYIQALKEQIRKLVPSPIREKEPITAK
jgi:C-terminal processing protease CtpA/Prc